MTELTLRQAADYLNTSIPSLHMAIKRGKLHTRQVESSVVSIGYYHVVTKEELDRYREEHMRGPRKQNGND